MALLVGRIRTFLAFVAVLVAAGCGNGQPELETLKAGTVRIVGEGAGGEQIVLGSGFVVSDQGHVVTARQHLAEARAIYVQPSGASADDLLPAAVLWSSEEHDIAVLAVEGLKRPPLDIAEIVPEAGANLFLLSVPGTSCCAKPPDPELQSGAMGRVVKLPTADASKSIDAVMHSVAVRRGSEGGPLLDSCGAVVGIASLSLDPTGEPPQGIFFAATAAPLIAALKERGIPFQSVADPCRDL